MENIEKYYVGNVEAVILRTSMCESSYLVNFSEHISLTNVEVRELQVTLL